MIKNIKKTVNGPHTKQNSLKNVKEKLVILKEKREKNKKLPKILSTQFGDCFLSFLRLANIKEIDICDIEEYLDETFLNEETLRIMFDDVDPFGVIVETISELSIIGGAEFSLEKTSNARILFSRQTANEMIQLRHKEHQKEIKKLVDEYLKREKSIKRRLTL